MMVMRLYDPVDVASREVKDLNQNVTSVPVSCQSWQQEGKNQKGTGYQKEPGYTFAPAFEDSLVRDCGIAA
jgi:hypothetical protein